MKTIDRDVDLAKQKDQEDKKAKVKEWEKTKKEGEKKPEFDLLFQNIFLYGSAHGVSTNSS